MPDFVHTVLAFLLSQRPSGTAVLIFLGAAGLSFLVELIVYRTKYKFTDFFSFCFPAGGWTSKSALIDIVLFLTARALGYLTGAFDKALSLAAAALVIAGLHALFPAHTALHAGVITQVAIAVILCVVIDFGYFCMHYLEHKVDFLWELHKVHHSATFLSPITAVRTHPLAERLESLCVTLILCVPMGTIMYLYGLNYVEIALLMAAGHKFGEVLVLEVLHHTQFPISFGWLDYVLVSPRVHQFHHSAKYEHWDCNIGIRLSIWDTLFGTLVLPPKGEVMRPGIGRGAAYDQRYHSLHGAFVQPVVDSARVLFGQPVAELPPPESLAKPVSERRPRKRRPAQAS